MKTYWPLRLGIVSIGMLLLSGSSRLVAEDAASNGISSRTGNVDGVKLRYLTAGKGPAVILLHGYAETSRMWTRVIPVLAGRFTVIAPKSARVSDSDLGSI